MTVTWKKLAYSDQTMYIGTTAVAIDRTSAALTLAGITLTTPNIGTATGSASLNVLKAGDVMSGSLEITGTANVGLTLRQNTATKRFLLFVGDGSDGATADENYIRSLSTGLHFQAGATGKTEIVTFLSGGNVGIGTTNPLTKLDISGTGGLRIQSSTLGFATSGTGLELNYVSADDRAYISSVNRSTGVYKPMFFDATTLSLNPSRLGKVGIGTQTPTDILEIAGETYSAQNMLRLTANINDPGYYFRIKYGGTDVYQSIFTLVSSYVDGGGAHDRDVMTLVGSGNVGIGTTGPTQQLTLGGYGAIGMLSGNGYSFVTHQYGNDGQDNLSLANNYRRTDYNTGTIVSSAIGTTEILLQTNGGANPSNILFLTGAINTAPSIKMAILSGGNVGIGTNVPKGLLHVTGSFTNFRTFEMQLTNGTAIDIVADGSDDMKSIGKISVLVVPSATISSSCTEMVIAATNITYYLVNSGSDVVTLTTLSTGQVYVQRTGGTKTYKISGLVWYI